MWKKKSKKLKHVFLSTLHFLKMFMAECEKVWVTSITTLTRLTYKVKTLDMQNYMQNVFPS